MAQMGRSEPFGPRPAAHSIFKNPREKDAYGGECGGAGGRVLAPVYGIQSCAEVQSHHARGARESVGVPAKIGSYIIVQSHK